MTQAVEILESMKRLVETKHDRTINFKKQTGRKVIGTLALTSQLK